MSKRCHAPLTPSTRPSGGLVALGWGSTDAPETRKLLYFAIANPSIWMGRPVVADRIETVPAWAGNLGKTLSCWYFLVVECRSTVPIDFPSIETSTVPHLGHVVATRATCRPRTPSFDSSRPDADVVLADLW